MALSKVVKIGDKVVKIGDKDYALSKVVKIGDKDYAFELTVSAHRRIKAAAEVSLPDCIADVTGMRTKVEREKALDGFHAIMGDFDKLPKVIHAMIAPQLTANGITSEQFEELLDGPAYLAAGRAITQALIDFFQGDPRGKLLSVSVEIATKAAVIQEAWDKTAMAAMDRRLTTMTAAVSSQKGSDAADATIQEILTSSSTTLPESLVSILAPSP